MTHRQRFKTSSSWSSAFTTSQTYNLAGALTSQTYPSGHTVSYTYYDSTAGAHKPIGSLLTFSGNLGDGTTRTYADEILYNPQGQMIEERVAAWPSRILGLAAEDSLWQYEAGQVITKAESTQRPLSLRR